MSGSVLELFAGICSTDIAAMRYGRTEIEIEKDPLCFQFVEIG